MLRDLRNQSTKTMMSIIKHTFLSFLFVFICSMQVYSQQAVVASGKNVSGPNGSVSYTVGQVFYTLHTGHDGSVSEGVQQPYEIFVITSLPEYDNIQLICLAYPNPVISDLTLRIEYAAKGISYQLYDMNGKVISTDAIEESDTVISMNDLVPAIYFLKVFIHKREVKTFKIIKH